MSLCHEIGHRLRLVLAMAGIEAYVCERCGEWIVEDDDA